MSFVVLSHAEIETYFEERAVEVAKARMEELAAASTCVEDCFVPPRFWRQCLGASSRYPGRAGCQSSQGVASRIDIEHRLSDEVSAFVQRIVVENHGINEKNLLRMLLPIGFPHVKCDQLLVAALNDFAKDRGAHAHRRSAIVRKQIDPKTEFDRVQMILGLLSSIDAELDALLAEATR